MFFVGVGFAPDFGLNCMPGKFYVCSVLFLYMVGYVHYPTEPLEGTINTLNRFPAKRIWVPIVGLSLLRIYVNVNGQKYDKGIFAFGPFIFPNLFDS